MEPAIGVNYILKRKCERLSYAIIRWMNALSDSKTTQEVALDDETSLDGEADNQIGEKKVTTEMIIKI